MPFWQSQNIISILDEFLPYNKLCKIKTRHKLLNTYYADFPSTQKVYEEYQEGVN